MVVAFLVLGLASAASIRFATRHAKDDYRSAAAVARAALSVGDKVWWNADKFGALLYQVHFAESCNGAAMLFNPQHGFADRAPAPSVVIASKPDIYDAHGALAEYLSATGTATRPCSRRSTSEKSSDDADQDCLQ